MRFKILNKFWNLKFVPNLGMHGEDRVYGDCSDPSVKNKEIRIWQGAKDEEELSTIIHETLHASGWHIDEDFVTRFADDCARILWKLGYRRQG